MRKQYVFIKQFFADCPRKLIVKFHGKDQYDVSGTYIIKEKDNTLYWTRKDKRFAIWNYDDLWCIGKHKNVFTEKYLFFSNNAIYHQK